MSETNKENLLAGLTEEAQDGMESLPVMKDGNEPPDMLLALLNSPLKSMIDSQQAKIMGTCLTSKGVGTLLIIYQSKPTPDGYLEFVGTPSAMHYDTKG